MRKPCRASLKAVCCLCKCSFKVKMWLKAIQGYRSRKLPLLHLFCNQACKSALGSSPCSCHSVGALHLEEAFGRGATGVHHTLWDALAVELQAVKAI